MVSPRKIGSGTDLDDPRPSSRIPGFYKLSLPERLAELVARGIIEEADAAWLQGREGGLGFEVADNMIENAIGVLELPLGLGLNFLINGRDYVVPMAVEEPSVVAAVNPRVRRDRSRNSDSDLRISFSRLFLSRA